jgi:DNA modification methylase
MQKDPTEKVKIKNKKLEVRYVPIHNLKPADYNPRKISDKTRKDLKESIRRFTLVDPIIVNEADKRKNVVIGGHARLICAKELGYKKVPCVYLNIPDIGREAELNVRLNKNVGEFDWDLLANFSEDFLSDVGFSSEELDRVFDWDDDNVEMFDLEKELKKLNIQKIEAKKGDLYKLGNHRMLIGDSTVRKDVLRLMNGEKANMCFTDPPYLLDYLNAKRHGKPTEGFGVKKNRKYLETDVLPDDFTQKWMANVATVQREDFSIIVFENPKNLKTIWIELEKHWKYRNTITWHIPNRCSGFAAKYRFFNKTDIALVGTSGKAELNLDEEPDELFQNNYENALFATAGKPFWESYEKGKKYCPTDFVEFQAADEKSSGQSIVFGTKSLELLIPYMKVLTKRGDLIIEPFGGSGSTLIAAEKMGRRCFLIEKSFVYAAVIINRWEKLTNQKAIKVGGGYENK